MSDLSIEFLGTGTSTGVPQLLCDCDVCRSTDPHDKRLRTSALVRYKGKTILIDCGPDFREQVLRSGVKEIDAVLLTHIHYDHVGGLDDLRPFYGKSSLPIFARPDVIADLRARLPYCFVEHPYPGVPRFEVHEIGNDSFAAAGIEVTPISVMHYRLPIVGFKIGPLAYVTDCSHIDDSELEKMRNIPLLVLDALRQERHISHFSLAESLEVVKKVNPHRAVFIHMSHDIGLHAQVNASLPTNIQLAHDGMIVITKD